VSGRCPLPCRSPGDNIDYLTPRGTLAAVMATLQAQGLSVQGYGAADHITHHRAVTIVQAQVGAGKTVPNEQDGFVQLDARLKDAYDAWIAGRSNPTRIVLLAHSHGVVWTHALARAHPEVPISVMIDLDGVCDLWETDHRRPVQTYLQSLPRNPYGFDLSDSCGSVRVGHIRYDLKDVVYPNVAVNLEVQSQRLLSGQGGKMIANLPFDALGNIRTDGSSGGIRTFRVNGETHSSVTLPGSRAVSWVRAELGTLSAHWGSGTTAAQPAPAAP